MYLQKPVFERSINKIDILNTTPEQEYFQVPLIHNNKLSSIENIEGFKTDNIIDSQKFKKKYSKNISNLGKFLLRKL